MERWNRKAILLKIFSHSLKQTVEHPFVMEIEDEGKKVSAFYLQGFLKELAKVQPKETRISLLAPMKDGRFIIYDDVVTLGDDEELSSRLRKMYLIPDEESVYYSLGLIKDLLFFMDEYIIKQDSSEKYLTGVSFWGKTSLGMYHLPGVIKGWLQEFVEEPIAECIR